MKAILLFIFLIFSHSLFAQSWLWAKSAGGAGSSEGWDIAVDAKGNATVIGNFYYNYITFGMDTLPDPYGAQNIFVTRYDSSGNLLWAKSTGGHYNTFANAVATDSLGNSYVTGYFNSDSITFGACLLVNANTGHYAQFFLVKYDPLGNVLWAKTTGGHGIAMGNDVAMDKSGEVYVTGEVDLSNDSIIFGTDTLSSNTSETNAFLVKYNSSGIVTWVKESRGTRTDIGRSVATDALGNVYITGYFNSPLTVFGTDSLLNTGGPMNSNIFLVKYNPLGAVLWAKNDIEANDNIIGWGPSLAVDNSNNIYLTGAFDSTYTIFGTDTLFNAGKGTTWDAFFTKFDSTGAILWAKRAGGTNDDFGWDVATDASNNVYFSGAFNSSSITFGSITLPFPSGGNDPLFIVKCNSTDNVLCASSATSGGDDMNAIAADRYGNVYVGGDFACGTTPFVLGNDSLKCSGTENTFVAKYRCNAPETGTMSQPTYQPGITIYPNPSAGKFTIQITNNSQLVNGEIEVYNVLGQKVFSQLTIQQPQFTINLGNLTAGIYFMRLTTGGNVLAEKLIKE